MDLKTNRKLETIRSFEMIYDNSSQVSKALEIMDAKILEELKQEIVDSIKRDEKEGCKKETMESMC